MNQVQISKFELEISHSEISGWYVEHVMEITCIKSKTVVLFNNFKEGVNSIDRKRIRSKGFKTWNP